MRWKSKIDKGMIANMKTMAEWIDLYEKKAKEKFEHKQPFELVFFPEYGFAQIHVGNTALFVWQMCGNAKWWFDYLQRIAKENDRPYLVAYVRRSIKPYLRTFGFRIICIDGVCYHVVDKSGRKGTATLYGKDGNVDIYTIRCEVR